MNRRFFVLLMLLLLSSAGPVQAHGYIVRAIPANRAVLERPPTRLQYWFSESLEPRFSELHLRDSGGHILASGGVDARNATLMTLQIPPGLLADGAYLVELRPAFASDGHAVAESYVFFVGAVTGDIEGVAREIAARPLEVVWKALLLSATCLLFGAYTLYSAVFVPAWGSAVYPAGELPPRVMQRLNRIVWTGIGLAVIASLLALLQQTMVFFNVDALTALTGSLWQIVRSGSRVGDVWTARILLLVLLAGLHIASVHYPRAAPGVVRTYWTGNGWPVALIIGTQAINSHAAGSPVLPWAAVLMHWLHSLGVAFWAGGIVVLVLVLPEALRPYEGESRRAALLAVMQRFSRLMTGVVALVITTGIYNATNWFLTPADLATSYGTALAYKLLLVALLAGVALLHYLVLHPGLAVRMERFNRRFLPPGLMGRGVQLYYRLMRAAGTFAGTLRLEAVFALITLTLAGLLSATPVPEPEFVRTDVPVLTASQTIDSLTVSATLTPGAPGMNTLDIVVRRDDNDVTDALLELQIVNPDADWRTPWLTVDLVEPGLYVATLDTFDREGRWWTLLDINTGDPVHKTRAFFEWQVTAAAAVIQTRPPSVIHLVALLAVLLSAGFIVFPTLKRWAGVLNLHPASLLIAGGLIVITMAMLGFAVWMVQGDRQRTQELLLPPPARVNPVPPDAASLARGAAIYHEACIIWQTSSDFQPLLRRLDTLRDEDLYAIPAEGWRTIPPCQGELTEQETWDVVNFFRTRRILAIKQ